jgi:hypothetical protein
VPFSLGVMHFMRMVFACFQVEVVGVLVWNAGRAELH